MKKIKDRKITIRLDQETYDKFSSVCDEYETTVSKLVRKIIEQLIEKNENNIT